MAKVCLRSWVMLVLGVAALWSTAAIAEEDTFVPLFNGTDLSGWVNVNCAPETFSVRDGMIVSTGKPTGVMRTEKQYENFILELEWKHIQPQGNAGLFVWSDPVTSRGVPFTRSIEVQILDGRNTDTYTSHGDVFAIHGATFVPDRPHPTGAMRCLPSEHRSRPAGEWNHYRVVCRDGDIKLAVNGKVVSGGNESVPRKGYICLESEGSEVHFRNLRICELPGGNATAEQTADEAQGFQSLYTGLDLRGWTTDSERWQAKDWTLAWTGGAPQVLQSEREFGKGTFICDVRLPQAGNAEDNVRIQLEAATIELSTSSDKLPPGEWQRLTFEIGEAVTVRLNDEVILEGEDAGDAKAGCISISPPGVPMDFANFYFREAGE